MRRLASDETKYKMQAITKLEALRSELAMPPGQDTAEPLGAQTEDYWKQQCQQLGDLCLQLKQEVQRLQDAQRQGGTAGSRQAPPTPLALAA